MRAYILLLVALGVTLCVLVVALRKQPVCLDLSNIALVDPIVERLAIKRYPNDIVQQRLAIARWDSVRRQTQRSLVP